MVNLPNVISLARLCLVPVVIVCLVNGAYFAALVAFTAAGVSDALDGYIAKRFDMRSLVGAYLDPIADKTLIVSIFITLAVTGVIPIWLTVLVVSRDLIIVGGVILLWLVDKPVDIDPLPISKLNTVAQLCFLVLILAELAFTFGLGPYIVYFAVGVASLTVASMAAYFAVWLRHMAQ
jgi:cardiolipin synthase